MTGVRVRSHVRGAGGHRSTCGRAVDQILPLVRHFSESVDAWPEPWCPRSIQALKEA